MANPPVSSPTAGGPSGSTFSGPLNIVTSRGSVPFASGAAQIGPFFESNVTVSQSTANPMEIVGSPYSTGVTMPKAGAIVGITLDANDTWTASPPTVGAYIDDTVAMTITPATGKTTKTAFTTNLRSYPFAAGSQLKVKYTSGASLAPTGVDALCYVWVI